MEPNASLALESVAIPVHVETPDDPRGTVVLAPSAGGRWSSPSLTRLAEIFRRQGYRTVRFDFEYRAAGRAFPDPMPKCMACYRRVVEAFHPGGPLILSGQSMGGRVASMLAAEGFPCVRLICFAYPLHPEGQPEKLRDAHLPNLTMPTLLVNGTEDALCRRDLMEGVLARLPANVAMHWLQGVDHSLKPAKGSGRKPSSVYEEIESVLAG